MQNPYSEDELVEQPAIDLLKELGWYHQNCTHEFQYSNESHIGRETKSEVVLTVRLRAALERFNPDAPEDAINGAIEELLDRSIAPEGYIINAGQNTYDSELIDLSQIDFEQLAEQFNTEHKRTQAEKLKGVVSRKLKEMVQLNKSRMDLQEKFEQMIEEYNEGHIGEDRHLQEIFDFLHELSEEEHRADSEELSEEELAVFDLLTKPEPDLTVPQREEVKTAVKGLLETLKQENLVLDWRKQQQLRAQTEMTVQTILDEGLPDTYTQEMFEKKWQTVYQHVYESYYGEGRSIYTETDNIQEQDNIRTGRSAVTL